LAHGKRKAGLDVGDRRIGIAISDALGMTAQPVAVVERTGVAKDVPRILEVLADYDVELFVAGLPVEMSGQEGKQAQRVRSFCEALAGACDVPIAYQDERLTSVQGERLLIESGVRRSGRRKVLDKMAATLILQSHLDAQHRHD
jgi:putative Holliday junction resolvase